ncbi:hypothetical protein Btru_034475 [Bulinus truncatus]|nr:hypothetical protein Btru_034475 [Bulinus truncatus]
MTSSPVCTRTLRDPAMFMASSLAFEETKHQSKYFEWIFNRLNRLDWIILLRLGAKLSEITLTPVLGSGWDRGSGGNRERGLAGREWGRESKSANQMLFYVNVNKVSVNKISVDKVSVDKKTAHSCIETFDGTMKARDVLDVIRPYLQAVPPSIMPVPAVCQPNNIYVITTAQEITASVPSCFIDYSSKTHVYTRTHDVICIKMVVYNHKMYYHKIYNHKMYYHKVYYHKVYNHNVYYHKMYNHKMYYHKVYYHKVYNHNVYYHKVYYHKVYYHKVYNHKMYYHKVYYHKVYNHNVYYHKVYYHKVYYHKVYNHKVYNHNVYYHKVYYHMVYYHKVYYHKVYNHKTTTRCTTTRCTTTRQPQGVLPQGVLD